MKYIPIPITCRVSPHSSHTCTRLPRSTLAVTFQASVPPSRIVQHRAALFLHDKQPTRESHPKDASHAHLPALLTTPLTAPPSSHPPSALPLQKRPYRLAPNPPPHIRILVPTRMQPHQQPRSHLHERRSAMPPIRPAIVHQRSDLGVVLRGRQHSHPRTRIDRTRP